MPPQSHAAAPTTVVEFIDNHCANCHDDIELKGGLDLWSLSEKPFEMSRLDDWVHAYDRASSGEMPPKKKRRPPSEELDAFLKSLSEQITSTEQTYLATEGRSQKRRLNRYEYENTLRELLQLPHLSIRDSLPEDPTAFHFNKVGEALDVSHVQIARYLQTAEYSIRQAIASQESKPEITKRRYHTWRQGYGFLKTAGPVLRQTFPIVGLELQTHIMPDIVPGSYRRTRPDWGAASEDSRINEEAIVMLMSTYEPAEIQFSKFRAPHNGIYRLTFSGYSIWMNNQYNAVSKGRRPEPVTIYADSPPRLLRHVGNIDFGTEPTEQTIEVYLKKGETIRPDAARLVRSRPPDFKNPLQEHDGMPGVAFQWMEVEGPIIDEWPPKGHTLLFGDLPFSQQGKSHVSIESQDIQNDAETLLRVFLDKAYRAPVQESEVQRFTNLIRDALEEGHSFTESMIAGYTAILSSPKFIYMQPAEGKLDSYALAERLSYFLWNSPPDPELRSLASQDKLFQKDILDSQITRLLEDPRSRRFVDAFLDYWLDLRHMHASGPDAELYPEYQLDDLLVESMPLETQLYFSHLIAKDLGVTHLIDADFIIANERLASLYGFEEIRGSAFRRIPLPPGHERGGLMTQASVLKVTANGTTTSPVTRGVWIMERILGEAPPPPPPSVEAIESDIRGATTVREQLALHRSQESCNACHQKIDPAGFALENFDVMGGWRDRYRASAKGEGLSVDGFGHDGLVFKYLLGQPVDATGELPDGSKFQDIKGLKRLLRHEEEQLARNLVEQLSIYATGAPVRFSDRPSIQKIIEASRDSEYGVRSLIRNLIKSDLFLSK
ncbi:DUF1592 domain-containing protein [Pelagicoccus mobilis]|uniref:DUF1592 domain-containing protein n=1 Tax=Pelagicoccus mobilis TaxID=415221 RepID=A0A934RY81_9BACT|nr:DUF1592 domain-containing protein [Pelagicoccus mobilis]